MRHSVRALFAIMLRTLDLPEPQEPMIARTLEEL